MCLFTSAEQIWNSVVLHVYVVCCMLFRGMVHVEGAHVPMNGSLEVHRQCRVFFSVALYLLVLQGLSSIALKLCVSHGLGQGVSSYLCSPCWSHRPCESLTSTWVLGIWTQAIRLTKKVLYPLSHLPDLAFLYVNLLCISGHVLNESLSSQHCFRKRERPFMNISSSVFWVL